MGSRNFSDLSVWIPKVFCAVRTWGKTPKYGQDPEQARIASKRAEHIKQKFLDNLLENARNEKEWNELKERLKKTMNKQRNE